jgi:phosphoenolpyruvate-protein kinase (PTS system EI component)
MFTSIAFEQQVDDALSDLLVTDKEVLKALKSIKKSYIALRNSTLSDIESRMFAQLWGSEEHARRVDAFLNKSR